MSQDPDGIRIVEWNGRMERAQSRTVRGPLSWVGVPVKLNLVHTRLMRRHGPAGYGVWGLLILLAADRPHGERGFVSGLAQEIAEYLGVDDAQFWEVLSTLVGLGLVEVVGSRAEEMARLVAETQCAISVPSARYERAISLEGEREGEGEGEERETERSRRSATEPALPGIGLPASSAPSAPTARVSRADLQSFLTVWNEARGGMKKAHKLTALREKQIRKALKVEPDLETHRAAITAVAAIPWNVGDNPRTWRANVDFYLQDRRLGDHLDLALEQPDEIPRAQTLIDQMRALRKQRENGQ